jgi:hypothetical protein
MARVKAKDYEDLSDANIRKVIAALNASPPISKKEACEMLKISYNTNRLSKIIEEFNSTQENKKRLRNKKKGLPATNDEIQYIIKEYINGSPLYKISEDLYRSTNFIKAIVDHVGIPVRESGFSRLRAQLLPENCFAVDFEEGEIAWSAQERAKCKIVKRLEDEKYISKYGVPCYTIMVFEHSEDSYFSSGHGFFASALAYDLGKLTHLEQYGINLNDL